MNPAELASQIALEKLFSALDNRRSFRFEAGAGAGKTYSLIKALKHIIQKHAIELARSNQKVACLTYTNVAVNEIQSRIDNNPLVFAGTLHEFSWNLIQAQQKEMRDLIPKLSDKWSARISDAGGITNQTIKYDLGYPKATESEIYLHHDDVIKIITLFLGKAKFLSILNSRFPLIFIDEYQDTNKDFADAIVTNIIEKDNRFQIGLFGDHWQKIYGSKACGLIDSDKLEVINKEANFRSEKNIVEVLKKLRPELPQNESDPSSQGDIIVYLTESWPGVRRTDRFNHWTGDLPSDIAHQFLENCKDELVRNHGWSFEEDKTKILMLTNNLLASEQGYSNIASLFSNSSDEYLRKENHYISFLIDTVEPMCSYFKEKKYGEMFRTIDIRTIGLKNHDDKTTWNNNIQELINIKESGTIGEVIDFVKGIKRPRLSSKIEDIEEFLSMYPTLEEEERKENESRYIKYSSLRDIPYSEVVSLGKYIDDKTPFSTKHGVKGAEFENVLVVCGRGWNQYNWKDFLEWSVDRKPPRGKEDAYERNRNLFYVACSRPKKRLALLFTQKLSETAVGVLNEWFGIDNVKNKD